MHCEMHMRFLACDRVRCVLCVLRVLVSCTWMHSHQHISRHAPYTTHHQASRTQHREGLNSTRCFMLIKDTGVMMKLCGSTAQHGAELCAAQYLEFLGKLCVFANLDAAGNSRAVSLCPSTEGHLSSLLMSLLMSLLSSLLAWPVISSVVSSPVARATPSIGALTTDSFVDSIRILHSRQALESQWPHFHSPTANRETIYALFLFPIWLKAIRPCAACHSGTTSPANLLCICLLDG